MAHGTYDNPKAGTNGSKNRMKNLTNKVNGKKYPTTVAGAKRELRKNPRATADEISVKGFDHDRKKYDRLLHSRAFVKSEANKKELSVKEYKKQHVEKFNEQQEAAGNKKRKKIGVLGKMKTKNK